MRVIIIGSGRMGQRHAAGAAEVKDVSQITLTDISERSLSAAKEHLTSNLHSDKFNFQLNDDLNQDIYDVAIIAATAQNRIQLCETALKKGARQILIEKPLGQSIAEVSQLIEYFNGKDARAYANLNMRLYPDSLKLKNDLQTQPQFSGVLSITVNTGTVGIGANGIHYLDYLFFLTDADDAQIIAAEIEDITIPSNRGEQFRDFGGWCVIRLTKSGSTVAKAYISISPVSTVFGGWDIIGSHGRITINECNGKRVDYIRKANSEMPVQRYHADYEPPVESSFNSPFLGDLTRLWIEGLFKREYLLPSLEEARASHQLMFDWLSYSKVHREMFPIT